MYRNFCSERFLNSLWTDAETLECYSSEDDFIRPHKVIYEKVGKIVTIPTVMCWDSDGWIFHLKKRIFHVKFYVEGEGCL